MDLIKVLVAEDTPDQRAVAELHLRRLGFTVLGAADGREAVEIALRERPAAIVMDMEMPVMTGLEAVRLLREAGFAAPVLAMTAHVGAREKAAALAAGCDGVLSKPVNPAQLKAALASALGPRQPAD